MKRLALIPLAFLAAASVDAVVFSETVPEQIDRGAIATHTADRGEQVLLRPVPAPPSSVPPTPVTGEPDGLEGCDLMRWHRVNVGLPPIFDKIVWGESRCQADPSVRTFCCVGPLQLYVSLHLRDHRLVDRYHQCGVFGISDVNGREDLFRHYCAAKALYDVMGTQPWKATR